MRVDDTHIEAHYIGTDDAVISLELVAPVGGIAAGTSGTVSVVATLNDNLLHSLPALAQPFFNAGSIGVIGTDSGGDTVAGTVSVSVKDDVPARDRDHASVPVYEDALGHGGAETPAGSLYR